MNGGSSLNTATLEVGRSSVGTLTLQGGGLSGSPTALTNSGLATLGTNTGSSGTVNIGGGPVLGPAWNWSSSGMIEVGRGGIGTLNIGAGGTVTSPGGVIGRNAFSSGSATVSGTGALWTVNGDLHVCFGVTEPGAGLDTTRITTFAKRDGDRYIVNGRKVWISKAMESEKILLLTRTTKFEDSPRKTDGLTLFLTDLDRNKVDIRPIPKMGRNAVSSNELFIDGLEIPVEDRVGEEGEGFKYILDGLNPERCLIAAEALGIGRAALRTAVRYANEREVFGRPIGMNQGIQFPLADSLAKLDAAELMLRKATWLYDKGMPCGREANTAKYLCAEAGFDAADRALQTHGGMGYSEEYHVARYFREARLTRIAPVSQEMILNFLGSHVLGLPRSY